MSYREKTVRDYQWQRSDPLAIKQGVPHDSVLGRIKVKEPLGTKNIHPLHMHT